MDDIENYEIWKNSNWEKGNFWESLTLRMRIDLIHRKSKAEFRFFQTIREHGWGWQWLKMIKEIYGKN